MALGIGAGQQSRIDCTRVAGSKVDTWWLRRHPAVRRLSIAGATVQEQVNREADYLAGELADDTEPLSPDDRREWLSRLDGVSYVSDGLMPFRDNVDHARRHGVRFIAESGHSIRSPDIIAACRQHGIALSHIGVRLFCH